MGIASLRSQSQRMGIASLRSQRRQIKSVPVHRSLSDSAVLAGVTAGRSSDIFFMMVVCRDRI